MEKKEVSIQELELVLTKVDEYQIQIKAALRLANIALGDTNNLYSIKDFLKILPEIVLSVFIRKDLIISPQGEDDFISYLKSDEQELTLKAAILLRPLFNEKNKAIIYAKFCGIDYNKYSVGLLTFVLQNTGFEKAFLNIVEKAIEALDNRLINPFPNLKTVIDLGFYPKMGEVIALTERLAFKDKSLDYNFSALSTLASILNYNQILTQEGTSQELAQQAEDAIMKIATRLIVECKDRGVLFSYLEKVRQEKNFPIKTKMSLLKLVFQNPLATKSENWESIWEATIDLLNKYTGNEDNQSCDSEHLLQLQAIAEIIVAKRPDYLKEVIDQLTFLIVTCDFSEDTYYESFVFGQIILCRNFDSYSEGAKSLISYLVDLIIKNPQLQNSLYTLNVLSYYCFTKAPVNGAVEKYFQVTKPILVNRDISEKEFLFLLLEDNKKDDIQYILEDVILEIIANNPIENFGKLVIKSYEKNPQNLFLSEAVKRLNMPKLLNASQEKQILADIISRL